MLYSIRITIPYLEHLKFSDNWDTFILMRFSAFHHEDRLGAACHHNYILVEVAMKWILYKGYWWYK